MKQFEARVIFVHKFDIYHNVVMYLGFWRTAGHFAALTVTSPFRPMVVPINTNIFRWNTSCMYMRFFFPVFLLCPKTVFLFWQHATDQLYTNIQQLVLWSLWAEGSSRELFGIESMNLRCSYLTCDRKAESTISLTSFYFCSVKESCLTSPHHPYVCYVVGL